MMKKGIRLSIMALLAALMAVSVFSGCQKNDGDNTGSTGESGNETGKSVLTIATNAEFEPFEFMQDNEIVGFDIDLINAIAEKIDMTVEIKNMEFDGTVAAVQSGTCKAAISGMTITPKREKAVIFSTPYYATTQILLVRGDDDVFTGETKEVLDEQLKGKTIGVCSGFTGESYVNGDEDMGFTGIADAKATVFDNISLAVTALKNKSIDCIVMDNTVAKQAASSAGNEDIKAIDVTLTTENYAIALNKNDEALKEKIDTAINELKDSGKIAELYEKWDIE
ncbi:MAG: basic amino acid ABC transporter substrate-binding protein [Clostridiales bacterium]|nr:basic amino acid ABC transporter substrate-binding protein [Clostridiales bacterium]